MLIFVSCDFNVFFEKKAEISRGLAEKAIMGKSRNFKCYLAPSGRIYLFIIYYPWLKPGAT